MADASVSFLEDGEGEGDSAKSEMMVASSNPTSRPLRGHFTTAGKGVGFLI